jgi:hypothetical protein
LFWGFEIAFYFAVERGGIRGLKGLWVEVLVKGLSLPFEAFHLMGTGVKVCVVNFEKTVIRVVLQTHSTDPEFWIGFLFLFFRKVALVQGNITEADTILAVVDSRIRPWLLLCSRGEARIFSLTLLRGKIFGIGLADLWFEILPYDK